MRWSSGPLAVIGMREPVFGDEIITQIGDSVAAYEERREDFLNLADRLERDLTQNYELHSLIHSTKRREKDPDHLRDKLMRKARAAMVDGRSFGITAKNLFREIDDLAGVRLLHIHTEQLLQIHPIIM